MPYFYDYLWHTLSSTQRIVWCGYGEDKSISLDRPQQDCAKIIETLNGQFSVLCVQYVPLFAMHEVIRDANERDRLWVFVSEQTSLDYNRNIYSKHARDFPSIRFIHYSDANIDHLHKENLTLQSRHYLLPFVPCSLAPFEKYAKQEKLYDIAFVGHYGPYREEIIDKLRKMHKLVDVQVFGEQRDMLVAQSRVLVNIHYNQHYRTLESLRCVMALLSGTVVVSENSTKQTLSSIERQIIFANYDELIRAVDNALADYRARDESLRSFLGNYSTTDADHCAPGFALANLKEIKS